MGKNHKWYQCWDFYLAWVLHYLFKTIVGLLAATLGIGFGIFIISIVYLAITTFFTWILQFLVVIVGFAGLVVACLALAWLVNWADNRKKDGC